MSFPSLRIFSRYLCSKLVSETTCEQEEIAIFLIPKVNGLDSILHVEFVYLIHVYTMKSLCRVKFYCLLLL